MTRTLAALAAALITSTAAHAAPQCVWTSPGISYLSEHRGVFNGPNFLSRITCSGYTPVIVKYRDEGTDERARLEDWLR